MKSFKFLVAIVLIGILFSYSGCKPKSDPGPSAQDQQLTKLSKAWTCTDAKLNNVTQTGYTNFKLTISSTAGQNTFGYSCAGRPTGTKSSPWPASGNFTFGTDFATQLTRDDGTPPLPVTYSVTDTQLQLTFTYSGQGYDGRVGNVLGTWVYTFKP